MTGGDCEQHPTDTTAGVACQAGDHGHLCCGTFKDVQLSDRQHLWRALTQVPGCHHNMLQHQTDTAGAEEKADTVAPLSVTQPLQSVL